MLDLQSQLLSLQREEKWNERDTAMGRGVKGIRAIRFFF